MFTQAVGSYAAIKDYLALINEIGVLFANTITFRNIPYLNSTDKFRPLYPTRWTVRK